MRLSLLPDVSDSVTEAYFSAAPLRLAAGADVCAEDPFWEASPVPRLARLCVRSLAR